MPGLTGALPLGVISRTSRIGKANLLCLSELTQHQMAVAVLASSYGREAFYAGLFHDSYKTAMDWDAKGWRHKGKSKYSKLSDFLNFLEPLTSLDLDVVKVAKICWTHHDDRVINNPIKRIEVCLGEPKLERLLYPGQGVDALDKMTKLVARFMLVSPYRAFVASMLFEKFLNEASKAYGSMFSKFGLRSLHVIYEFGKYDVEGYQGPQLDLDVKNGRLEIRHLVRAPSSLSGLVIEHEYLPDRDTALSVRGNHVSIRLGLADLLVFPLPVGEGIEVRALVPLADPDGGRTRNWVVRLLEEALKKTVKKLASMVKDHSIMADMEAQLLDALEHYRRADRDRCMFCGAPASFKTIKSGLGRFVDVDRTVAHGNLACAPCKLAYDIEEKHRGKTPFSVMSLPAAPDSAEMVRGVRDGIGITEEMFDLDLPPLKTVADEPWAMITSWAFYHAITKRPDEYGFTGLRPRRDLDPQLFRFFLTRRVMLYPFIFKMRPMAILSAWTKTRQKKFILNVDSASGFVVLPGMERDLTLEDLDELEPIAEAGDSVLRKTYTQMLRIYGMR